MTTTYIVYVGANEHHNARVYHTTCDLNEARDVARDVAHNDHPGEEIHIAARISTFKAETVVRERADVELFDEWRKWGVFSDDAVRAWATVARVLPDPEGEASYADLLVSLQRKEPVTPRSLKREEGTDQ
jgi:hypothetical protein